MKQSKLLVALILLLALICNCGGGEKAKRPLAIDIRPDRTPLLLYTYGATSVSLDTLEGGYKADYDRDTLDFFLLTDTTGLIESVLIPDTTKLTYKRGKITGARYGDEVMEWQRLVSEAGDSITGELRDFYGRMEGRRLSLFYAMDGLSRYSGQEDQLLRRLITTARYSHSDLATALGLSSESGYSRFPDWFHSSKRIDTKDFIKPDHFAAVLALGEADADSTSLKRFYHIADSLGVKSILLMVGWESDATYRPKEDKRTLLVSDSIGEASLVSSTLRVTSLPSYFVIDTLMSVIDSPESLERLTDYILDHDTIPLKKSKK